MVGCCLSTGFPQTALAMFKEIKVHFTCLICFLHCIKSCISLNVVNSHLFDVTPQGAVPKVIAMTFDDTPFLILKISTKKSSAIVK